VTLYLLEEKQGKSQYSYTRTRVVAEKELRQTANVSDTVSLSQFRVKVETDLHRAYAVAAA
jgi:outer membrane lipopolysaccharide assembly protein LptE/RlpB